jgi:predicted TIM-barrel fold metal-dependent hydrolase
MDAAGIGRSILLGWYWQRQETCEWHNRYYLECVQAHPDRLSAFATVQANSVDAALREMEWAADQGFIGLGELCPRAFGTSLLEHNWMRVFQNAAERGWPVNLHVTDPAGRSYEGRVQTPLEEFIQLAAE